LSALMLHSPAAVTEEAIALHRSNIARARFDSRKLSWRPILLENLPRLRCPVQILWGEYDSAAYPSVEARAALCRAAVPAAQIKVIVDAGHWAQFEKADEVNSDLLTFLGD
jgi:pimeloyl-ACP methyl ester carboxylesterase